MVYLMKAITVLAFHARRPAATMLNASSDADGLSRMAVNLWVSLRTLEIQPLASRRVYEVDERQGPGHPHLHEDHIPVLVVLG
jgi:hypothetical protein